MFESTRLYIVGSQLVYNRLRNVQHHTAAHLKMSKKNTETKTSRSQPEPASSPQITINQGPDNQQHQDRNITPSADVDKQQTYEAIAEKLGFNQQWATSARCVPNFSSVLEIDLLGL